MQLCIHCMVRENYLTRVPPFGHPRIKACLRLPEALSLFATSFFGSWCLGILRVLFLAYPYARYISFLAPLVFDKSRSKRYIPRGIN